MNLPNFESYGSSTSRNYGVNCLRFNLGGLVVWFSYRTPVAFQATGNRIVRENSWGSTTGKHLNRIDGGGPQAKRNRIAGPEFERLLSETVSAVSK